MMNDWVNRRWFGIVLAIVALPHLDAQEPFTQRPLGIPAAPPEKNSPNAGQAWSQRVLPLPDRSIADVQGQKALLDELSRWADLRSQLEQFKQLAEKNPDALRSLQGALNEDQRKAIQDILGKDGPESPIPIPDGFRSPNGFPTPRNQSQDGKEEGPAPKPNNDDIQQRPSVDNPKDNRSGSSEESELFKDVPSYENIDPFAPLPPDSPKPQEPNLPGPRPLGNNPGINQSKNPGETPTPTRTFPDNSDQFEGRSQTQENALAPLELEPLESEFPSSPNGLPSRPLQDELQSQFSPEIAQPAESPNRSPSRALSDDDAQKLQRDVRKGNVRKAFQEILADARKESAERRKQAQEATPPHSLNADNSLPNPAAANTPSPSTMPGEDKGGEQRAAIKDRQSLPQNSDSPVLAPGSSPNPTQPSEVPQGNRSGMQNFDSGMQNSPQSNTGNRNNFERENSSSEGWKSLFGDIAQSLYDTISTAPEASQTQEPRSHDSNVTQPANESQEASQAPVFLLQSLLGLGIVAAIIWAVLKSRQSSEQQQIPSSSASPRWQIENGKDLMTVFHQLALGHLRLEKGAPQSWFTKAGQASTKASVAEPWWNHRRAASLMMTRQPGHDDRIELLTRLYERVRYSALGDNLDPQEVAQARQAVEKLRGC